MPTEEYRKMVNERIGRAVREGSRSRFEENTGVKDAGEDEAFAIWLKKAKRNQMERRRRCVASVAAVFLCLFLGAGLLYYLPADNPAFAGHADNDQVEKQGGSIVIGGDGNGNVGTWTATFTSDEDIPEQYKEEIIWFEELPEGYEIKVREVPTNEDTAKVLLLKNFRYYGEYANITVYYKRIKETTWYSFFTENTLVTISGIEFDEKKGGSD